MSKVEDEDEQLDVQDLVRIARNRYNSGMGQKDDIIRAQIELELADAQLKSARASESNARYMLWSVIAAAISAFASLASTAIAVFGHH